MTVRQFIHYHALKSADAIVVKKNTFKIFDHYIIFLGYTFAGAPLFMANMIHKGVTLLSEEEVAEFTDNYTPTRLNRFIGNLYEREQAVERAIEAQDSWSYKFILQNCEHFANWVQNGVASSKQTRIVGTGAVIGGLAIAASSENKTQRNLGLLTAGLGALTLFLEGLDDEK